MAAITQSDNGRDRSQLGLMQVEYLVVALDDVAKKARLSLAQAEILKSLARDEALWKSGSNQNGDKGDQ